MKLIIKLIFVFLFILLMPLHNVIASDKQGPEAGKFYNVDFVTNGDFKCHREANNLNCRIWYEKKRFIIEVNHSIDPDSGKIKTISALVKETQLIEKIPGSGQTINVLLNGLSVDTVHADTEGDFNIHLSGEGVYEFNAESDEFGVVLNKELFVE